MNKGVYINGFARTPIGGFGGSLSSYTAVQLGSMAIRGALQKAGLSPELVQEVYMGNVLSAGLGQSPARQAALGAGIHAEAEAVTVNKVCASGLKAVSMGWGSLQLGKAQQVVVGGMESMSNTPFYATRQRFGHKMGHTELKDGVLLDGLWDPYHQFHMGNAAELCVKEFGFSREAQDAYAVRSYTTAIESTKHRLFQEEIIPVKVPGKEVPLQEDEDIYKVNYKKLPILPPSFEQGGTITAANASNLNDGAAALVLSAERTGESIACILDYADAAQAPERFTTSPAIAIQKLLRQNGLHVSDIDLWEINEAYACVPMANAELQGISLEKINVLGGAVAMGHPIGASGARILITLLTALHNKGLHRGIAAICNGGGGATAVLVELV